MKHKPTDKSFGNTYLSVNTMLSVCFYLRNCLKFERILGIKNRFVGILGRSREAIKSSPGMKQKKGSGLL